jgi:hypothetical protein
MCLALAVPAASAGAVDIEKERTETVLWAAVAARSLNVRAEPSMEAAAEFQLPRGAYVAIVEELGQPARIDGQEDSWTLIATETCANEDCTLLKGGWVADSWLGYQERFERLSEWREGRIEERVGDVTVTYDIDAEGGFKRLAPPCEGENCGEDVLEDGCHEDDMREDEYCVGQGDLYRYRSLVWVRGYGYFFIDGKDNLCSVHSGRDGAPRMCDR